MATLLAKYSPSPAKAAAVKLLRAAKVDSGASVMTGKETLLAMCEELEEKVAAARAALEAL